MTDQKSAADYSDILIAAISDENFTPTKRLPIATACREYVITSELTGEIYLSFVLFSKMGM